MACCARSSETARSRAGWNVSASTAAVAIGRAAVAMGLCALLGCVAEEAAVVADLGRGARAADTGLYADAGRLRDPGPLDLAVDRGDVRAESGDGGRELRDAVIGGDLGVDIVVDGGSGDGGAEPPPMGYLAEVVVRWEDRDCEGWSVGLVYSGSVLVGVDIVVDGQCGWVRVDDPDCSATTWSYCVAVEFGDGEEGSVGAVYGYMNFYGESWLGVLWRTMLGEVRPLYGAGSGAWQVGWVDGRDLPCEGGGGEGGGWSATEYDWSCDGTVDVVCRALRSGGRLVEEQIDFTRVGGGVAVVYYFYG